MADELPDRVALLHTVYAAERREAGEIARRTGIMCIVLMLVGVSYFGVWRPDTEAPSFRTEVGAIAVGMMRLIGIGLPYVLGLCAALVLIAAVPRLNRSVKLQAFERGGVEEVSKALMDSIRATRESNRRRGAAIAWATFLVALAIVCVGLMALCARQISGY